MTKPKDSPVLAVAAARHNRHALNPFATIPGLLTFRNCGILASKSRRQSDAKLAQHFLTSQIAAKIIDQLFHADLLGVRKKLEQIEDDVVLRVFDSGEPEELRSSFAETHMLTSPFTGSYAWIYPLLMGQSL